MKKLALTLLILSCANPFLVASADDCDFLNSRSETQGSFCCKDWGRIARKCDKQDGQVCEYRNGNDKYPGTVHNCEYIFPEKRELDSKEPLVQMARFREMLIELLAQPRETIREAFEDTSRFLTPTFGVHQISQLYKGNLDKIKNGQDAQVSKAVSKIDRPDVGIVQDQLIAVRGTRFATVQEFSSNSATLLNFARASVLRDPANPITEFFPTFYGSYKANGSSGAYHPVQLLSFQEMELASSDFEDAYSKMDRQYRKPLVPDSLVFEFCLGEWAGAYFSKIGSYDAKAVNFGVKRNIGYSRTYKIEGKEFIISSDVMPKRLDVGGAGTVSEYAYARMKKGFSCSIPNANYNLSWDATKFLSNLGGGKNETFLDAFEAFYQSSQELKDGAKVRDENRVFAWPALQ